MKQYFDFNLKGIKLLPYFLIIILLTILSNLAIQGLYLPKGIITDSIAILAPIFIIGIYTFILPLSINATKYSNTNLYFSGSKKTLFGKMIGGSFLNVITLGLYSPWFYTSIANYCAKNTKLLGNNFEFNGKPISLFAYLVLGLYAPLSVVLLLIFIMLGDYEFDSSVVLFFFSIIMLALTPFMFYINKWLTNISYKEYSIQLRTNNFEGCFHVFAQVFLSIITCGLYMPWACVFIYRYFIKHTIATSNDRERHFGYDGNIWSDGVYILGQSVLMGLTLFVYSPWAFTNIYKRIFKRIYLTI